MDTTNRKLCPLCGQFNQCALENGRDSHSCWCMSKTFPKKLPRYNTCICEDCIDALVAQEQQESQQTG